MAIPAPPPDASGGYILFEFTDGSNLHKHKVHVAPFSLSTGLYTSPGGSELSPQATQASYLDIVKNLYNSNWSLFAQEVWQRSGTPSTFVIDSHTLASGRTGAGTPAGNQAEYVPRQLTCTMATATPNEKLRLIYLGFDQIGLGASPFVSTGSGGAVAALDTLVTYLLSANCMIRAHNGDKPRGSMRAVRTYNHRLRRKAGDV